MKKAYFLSVLIWYLLAFAACGKETEEAPHYYEIRVESGQLAEVGEGQFLLGQQYYQGEPVSIVAEPSGVEGAGSAMDVYICPMGGEKKLLMGGVPGEYRTPGWYLDEKGGCYIKGPAGITRLDADGKLLYKSRMEDVVTDICCLEGGRILLVTNKNSLWQFWELDPDTGETVQAEKLSESGGMAYIGAWGKNLMFLDERGFWRMDLKKGTKELALPFAGTLYSIDRIGEQPDDFWFDDGTAGILWSSGKVERLERVDITGEKEIVIVRGEFPVWLKNQISLFNQSNADYYAVLEEPGEGVSEDDFHTETNLKLTTGKGADIICSNAVDSDVSGLIEKGVFADLAPMMEVSGIREEDYFRAAFDAWREGDKTYGLMPNMAVHSYSLDKAVLNGREELTIGNLVDAMLEFGEDRSFYNSDGIWTLSYFLEGSRDLWGMVDWEKGTCDFGGELFSKMLRAAKRYADNGKAGYPSILGYRMCFSLYHFDLSKKLENQNQAAVGAFFDDGNYAESVRSIVLGINAESGHIEGAWQLLAFLLGEEAQSTLNYYYNDAFPVRISVFDKLAKEEMEYGETREMSANGKTYTVFIPGRFGEEVSEETVIEMRQMLSEARNLPYKVKPLLAIIKEETAYYFDGVKSEEEVTALVQNRVQLYLDEKE